MAKEPKFVNSVPLFLQLWQLFAFWLQALRYSTVVTEWGGIMSTEYKDVAVLRYFANITIRNKMCRLIMHQSAWRTWG